MAARTVELADAIVTAIQTAAGTAAAVARVWEVEVNPDEMAVGERVVSVYPVSDADQGPATRGSETTQYTFGVVTAEKYGGKLADKRAWVDGRVQWVNDTVKAVVGTAGVRFDGAYAEARETFMPDPDSLRENLFWMLNTVTLSDTRAV